MAVQSGIEKFYILDLRTYYVDVGQRDVSSSRTVVPASVQHQCKALGAVTASRTCRNINKSGTYSRIADTKESVTITMDRHSEKMEGPWGVTCSHVRIGKGGEAKERTKKKKEEKPAPDNVLCRSRKPMSNGANGVETLGSARDACP